MRRRKRHIGSRHLEGNRVSRLRGGSALLIKLIVAAGITAFVLIVALGHVLLVIAIYKCWRKDGIGGRRRRPPAPPQNQSERQLGLSAALEAEGAGALARIFLRRNGISC